MNAWLNVDENEAISSQMTEDDIISSVVEEPIPESDSEDEEEAEPIPSMKSVVQSIETTLKFHNIAPGPSGKSTGNEISPITRNNTLHL